MQSHVIDYEIFGDDMQYVEITLDPAETAVAEAGALMYMDDGIRMETKMGDGSQPDQGLMGKLMGAGKRMLTGETMFMTHFTAAGSARRKLAFAAPYPGKIVPVDLAQNQGKLICQKDAFLCAALGTRLGIQADFTKLARGLFGGEGFILQTIEGDGLAFLHACGTLMQRDLAPGELLRIDTGCVVAFHATVNYDIERVKGIKNMFFGGEGMVFATLRGPGRIWLQSLPFSRLAYRVLKYAPQSGGKSGDEGSVLGGLGRMLGGD